MVAVAQLVESRIVIPVVAGSSPVSHPKFSVQSGRYVARATSCASPVGNMTLPWFTYRIECLGYWGGAV
jgi:hypothetical protein